MAAWGWQKGEGERLIAEYGLPLMEMALTQAGWEWRAREKRWNKVYTEQRRAA